MNGKPSDPGWGKGNTKTQKNQRKKMRARLRQAGYSEEVITVVMGNRRIGQPLSDFGIVLPPEGPKGPKAAQKTFNSLQKPRKRPPEPILLTDEVIEARLRNEGKNDAEVAFIMEHIRYERLCERFGREEASRILYASAPEQPDDKKFKPKPVDSILKGPARVTGTTAKAVKRRRTYSRWEIPA